MYKVIITTLLLLVFLATKSFSQKLKIQSDSTFWKAQDSLSLKIIKTITLIKKYGYNENKHIVLYDKLKIILVAWIEYDDQNIYSIKFISKKTELSVYFYADEKATEGKMYENKKEIAFDQEKLLRLTEVFLLEYKE
ncbi:MAG: hypothetical protein RL023_76 [Candidatus Parcubacteria bacterium]|jgi:hypothetical protein